jgi:fluoroquinolone resistance protein
MQLNRNTLSSPIALCILVVVFAGVGVKTLLVDPMNSAGVLSGELTKLRDQHRIHYSSKARVNGDIQQLVRLIRQSKPSSETKLIEQTLLRLGSNLNGITKADTLQRDALALIAAEREQIKLTTGITSGFFQALGSGFILVTVFVAIRNLGLAQKNLKVSENKLTSEIIAKATDHLGSEASIVRLGGINTLIWIAKSLITKEDRESTETISNTLAGFIVIRSRLDTVDVLSSIPIDISAALLYLLNSLEGNQDVTSSKINLTGSQFGKRRFNGVSLNNLDLENSVLNSSDIKKSSISNCNLNQADLALADLSGCMIVNSQFSICTLENALLAGASLNKCTFTGSRFGSSFEFNQAQAISETDFSLAQLQHAIFDGLHLCEITFNGANLSGASFRDCKLENVIFDNANLNGAVFDKAKVKACSYVGTNLAEVSLHEADLEEVDLRGSKNLTQESLCKATRRQVNIDEWLKNELITSSGDV